MSAKGWRILAGVALVLLVAAAWAIGHWNLLDSLRAERVDAWLTRLGAAGPIGIIVAQVVQVVVAPMPGYMLGWAAGYAYGPWVGAALCLVGMTLGTLIAVWLARRLGRPLVERFAKPERLARLDDLVRRRGALACLVIFLVPFLPDDLCCLVAGLTPLRIGQVVLAALIGRAPGVLASTLIGSQAHALSWGQWAGIAAGSVLLAVLFNVYHDRLEHAMFDVVDRLLGRHATGEG